MKIVLILFMVALAGCTTTPQGKSIDRAQYTDMATTGIALAFVEGATEANPLGVALIPIKTLMGWYIERNYGCEDRVRYANASNSITYAAAANNIAVIAGGAGAAPLAIGAVAGLVYYSYHEDIEPETFKCDYEFTEND